MSLLIGSRKIVHSHGLLYDVRFSVFILFVTLVKFIEKDIYKKSFCMTKEFSTRIHGVVYEDLAKRI